MYRVIIADDHLMIREGVKQIFSRIKGYSVIGEAETGTETVKKASELECDLLIVDVNMPEMNGIEVLKRMKQLKPNLKVIVFSMYCDMNNIQDAIDWRADGYILKDDSEDIFLTVIQNVMKGYSNFSPRVQSVILKKFSDRELSPREVLTNREFAVFKLLIQGLTHKEIAEKSGVSVRTVDFHKRNIKDKLQVTGTVELIRIADRFGIK